MDVAQLAGVARMIAACLGKWGLLETSIAGCANCFAFALGLVTLVDTVCTNLGQPPLKFGVAESHDFSMLPAPFTASCLAELFLLANGLAQLQDCEVK